MKNKFAIKVILIAALSVALLVPLGMIESLVSERGAFRDTAKRDIAQSWTGTQKFLGPVLVVPYQEQYSKSEWDKNLNTYVNNTYNYKKELYLLPDELLIDSRIATEQRSRGLYKVPVYANTINVKGNFKNTALVELHEKLGNKLSWGKPFLSMLVTDIRGISEQPKFNWNQETYEFVSGSGVEKWGAGMQVNLPQLNDANVMSYPFSFAVNLKGMESIQFSPAGKTTEVNIEANWPHPSFIGRYLPTQYEVTDSGFKAKWLMSAFASDMPGIMQSCQNGNCSSFFHNSFGVSLINTVDIYQKTERSVKYAILFIALTFTLFFLFEVMKDLRLHPMQYLLVGLSLIFFYQLLLSLSEHLSFITAYFIAAFADILLIAVYISAALKSIQRALGIVSVLVLLYAMLYAILVSEDNAMLMGSLLCFTVLSVVMIATRKLDWYQVTDKLAKQNRLPRQIKQEESGLGQNN